jgi:sterol desaturase/sphingolipid hydroxylase (fatty acid hydroxylase superfamily)
MPNVFEMDPVIGMAIPFFLISIGLEYLLRERQHLPKWNGKDAWASIGMGLGSAVINIGMKTLAFMAYSWVYEHRLFDLGSAWWVWILLLFADDFAFYTHHRSCHEIRLFWAAHVNHHSSQDYNLAIALRQSWGELFHKYIWWIWLPLLGFHPLMMITMMTISLIYQFFQHTEVVKRLPKPLEWIFNTPSHHRVHHASNVRYLDRNHAGILIIWDKLFGTFQAELDEEPVHYGITNNIHTYNPFKIATHEYAKMIADVRKAPTFKAKMGYIFMPPGWSHDGSTKTANQMRKELKENLR